MSIIGVQLVLLAFAIFMIYVSFLHWRRKSFTNITYGVWMILWFGLIIFTLFPKVLEPLLAKLFFIRAMDFGMIVAFMVLTFLTIDNNVRIKRYEDAQEKLVRKLALKNRNN